MLVCSERLWAPNELDEIGRVMTFAAPTDTAMMVLARIGGMDGNDITSPPTRLRLRAALANALMGKEY